MTTTKSRATTIVNLPVPHSKTEIYLDYLVGRSTDLSLLPVPQSRIEEFLECLCYLKAQGGGGGGVQLPISAANVTFAVGNTGLQGNTVQTVIEELNAKTDLLKDSNIYIAQDNAELEQMLIDKANDLRSGDIFYVLDATNVVDYNGDSVNHDGKIIAMIYDEAVNGNKLRIFSKLDATINLDEYVHKIKENLVLGKTTLLNGYVVGETISSLKNQESHNEMNTNRNYFGSPMLSVPANTIVSCITLGISSSKQVGQETTGVQVGVISRTTNQVLEHLIVGETSVVLKNDTKEIGTPNMVRIPINQSWQEDVYFMVGANGMYWGRPNGTSHILAFGGNDGMPIVSATVSPNTANWIGNVVIHGEERSLNSVVFDWEDLSHVEKAENLNLYNIFEINDNTVYNPNGSLSTNNEWCSYVIDCEENDVITIYKRNHDSSDFVFFNENDGFVTHIRNSGSNSVFGKRYVITVPNDPTIKKVGFNIYKPNNNHTQTMLFKGNVVRDTYLPFTNGVSILVDSTEVAHSFINDGTNLKSETIHEAIKEVYAIANSNILPFLVATDLGLVGDDATDNSNMLQSLVQRSDVQGKMLFFPKGTYIIGSVGLRSNLHFVGEIGTVFKLKDGSNNIFGSSGQNNIKFENIDFFGGETTDRPSVLGNKVGVSLSSSRRVSFENCMFRGFDKTGLYVANQGAAGNHTYSYNLFINACRFEQSYYGMMFDVRAEYANIVGSTFGQNYFGAFVGGGNNQFSNCQFNNNQNGLYEVGGTTNGVTYSNNSHNSFTGCQFNHNGNRNATGHSVLLENVEVGIMFTGCQFFDGIMEFKGSTQGVIFSGCEGGVWKHCSNQTGKVMYTDCFFHATPLELVNNGNTIYHNNLPNDIFDSSVFVTESGDNNFVGQNNFDINRPTVTTFVNQKEVVVTGNDRANSNYWINYDNPISQNTHIESVAIPVIYSETGDSVSVSLFVANTTTKEFIETICDNQEFTVVNHNVNGTKSVIVPVNKSYQNDVSFGFRIANKNIDGRQIGLKFDRSGTTNSGWNSTVIPTAGNTMTPQHNIKIAYAIVTKNVVDIATMDDIIPVDIDNLAKLNEDNVFTGQNNFDSFKPTVSKFTNIDIVSLTGSRPASDGYWINFDNQIAANTKIDAITIPIINAIVGDTIDVSVFIANTDTKAVVEYICDRKILTVIDHNVDSHKCVIVPIDKTYAHPVSFGFRIIRKEVNGRTIALKFNDTGLTQNTSWGSVQNPSIGQVLTPNQKYKFSYATASRTRVEVAIIDDLANYVPTSDVANTANKIPRIQANGKLPISIIPDSNTNNLAKLNEGNTFTERNNFTKYSPMVSKYFTLSQFANHTANLEILTQDIAWANLNYKFKANQQIDDALIPIVNGEVGDNISAYYFVINTGNNQMYQTHQHFYEVYQVVDVEYMGHKCLRIPINKSFGVETSIGFRIQSRTIGNRQVGAAYTPNGVGTDSWTHSLLQLPSNGTYTDPNSRYVFPYKIGKYAESEMVTRFDIQYGTVPSSTFTVGELKTLFYDAGENAEIGGRSWLRCDGQTVQRDANPTLFDAMQVANTQDTVTLPTSTPNNYIYICTA